MIRNGVQYLFLNIEDIVSSLWKHKAVFKTRTDSYEICRRKMQKTSQTKNSSFNRINVVRIFKKQINKLHKNISSKNETSNYKDLFMTTLMSKETILKNISKNGKYVLPKFLKENNITPLECYNICFGEKRCKYCGEVAKFISFDEGYKEYCYSKECRKTHSIEKRRQTCLDIYGVDSVIKVHKFKDKQQETYKKTLDSLGVKNISQLPEVREKISHTKNTEENKEKTRKTCLEKYGETSYSKTSKHREMMKNQVITEEIIQKTKKTKKEKYGNENYNNIEKTRQTNLERYGKEYGFQAEEVKDKIRKTKKERYDDEKYINIEKIKETNKQKYGSEFFLGSEKFSKTRYDGMIKEFGVKFFKQSTAFKNIDINKEEYNRRINEDFNESFIKTHFIENNRFLLEKFCEYFSFFDIKNISRIKKRFNITESNLNFNITENIFIDEVEKKLQRSLERQKYIVIDNKKYFLDGYDKETNTIYEFLGDYWHGNPEKYNGNNINKKSNKNFSKLYNETLGRFKILKNQGYNIKYIWYSDFQKEKLNSLKDFNE